MSYSRLVGRRRPALFALAVIAASTTPLGLVALSSANAQLAGADKDLFIVQVEGDPVASYDGGVPGFAPTRPGKGKKLDADSKAANAYQRYLTRQHNATLASTGLGPQRKVVDYSVAFNGYAAELTDAEAASLAHTDGVVRVWENEILAADTTSTPAFLGLTGGNGTWAQEFGGAEHAGEGVIVGVIDSGYWPDNASFSALSEPRPDAADIAAQWNGSCDAGTEMPVACNNKVLGARYYNASKLATEHEFMSPRDFHGHGSHTAGTAAGNHGVAASINGGSVGEASGIAPAARLAVYKALWHQEEDDSASGGTADLVAAIDDAVEDGVDVINYSISGSRQFVVDPVEIAFLNAAASNVFVATSAGNSGDTVGTSSVAHNSPWLMTVAASTHDRGVRKTVTLGNGATYSGVGVGPGVGPDDVVDAAASGLAGANATRLKQCYSDDDSDAGNGIQPLLDPAKVAGKIVLCERGGNARVDKSIAVANGGGVGMIQNNVTPAQSLNADFHSVPSIHLDSVSGAAVKAYVTAGGTPTATISATDPTPVRAPQMAGFSSFGPALAGSGDLLKPDITAPGVDVIAAVAPPGNNNNSFDAYSGTSMSSPHVAGLAALIKSDKPNWSPMWIKSALMTNATPLDNEGEPIQRSDHDATPLDYGSGHVRPGLSFDPGLVYDSAPIDWLRYGCGINQIQLITAPSFCQSVGSIDPSDLNYPSVAFGDLAGTQTVTRTVTNTSVDQASIYRLAMNAPAGFDVKVTPSKLTVPPLKSRSFKISVSRTTAALGEWGFGAFTWSDKRGHSVRSPLAIRPVALAAPTEVAFTGTSGTGTVTGRAGYTGVLQSSVAGLVAATVTPFALDTTGPSFNPLAPTASTQTGMLSVTVPAGTTVARFATFDADYPADTDVDVFVYLVSGTTRTLVGSSAGGTAEEIVTLSNPEAGTYEVYADLFAVPTGTTETVEVNHWLLGSAATGNLTASPASQPTTTGQPFSVTLNWTGLAAGVRHLGTLNYSDGTNPIGRTIVTVSP